MSSISYFAYKGQNWHTLSQVRLEIAYEDNAFQSAKDVITFFHLLLFFNTARFYTSGRKQKKNKLAYM